MAFTTTATLAGTRSPSTTWVRNGGITVAGTLFLALCSHISLPLPGNLVPLNLQPFGVVLLALMFGPVMGAATAVLYLVEGAMGLPVFSPHGPGGIAQLLGPSGGYLMSYPAAAWLTGRLRSTSFLRALGAAAAGDALVLLGGSAWLALLMHASLFTGFRIGAIPFLPGDFLKCAAAAGVTVGFFAWRTRQTER